ncbi:unnamed protein product [Withania somnifera]
MLVLIETPAGFALFKVLDEGKLSKVEDLSKEFTTFDSARKVVKLKAFSKFENTSEALSAATLLIDSKPSKGLRKFLKMHCEGETLGVADSKPGNKIKEELVNTMIVQAIGLLDDLDKELNTYAMRVREWYGWHFPELAKIVQDNILYAKAVKLMGDRVNAAKLDFSEPLDLENIRDLCNQVLSFSEYGAQLYDYLESRMNTIAPNLTALVGELVGARLIAYGGSLLNLAKQPGSTVQILGAEKALFRALKTKHANPKYGLIYHASLIGQAAPKHKVTPNYHCHQILLLETRLRALEGKELTKSAGSAKGKPKIEVYDKDHKKGAGALITPAKKKSAEVEDNAVVSADGADIDESEETGTKEKKKKKKKRDDTEENVEVEKSKKNKRKHSDANEDENENS